MTRGLVYIAALLCPVAAQAHGLSPAIGGFYAGGLLVLVDPADLLQWAALGVFAAAHPPEQAGWVAEALVTGLLAGFVVSWIGLFGSVPLLASTAALLAVGALLIAGTCIPFAALVGLAAGVGWLHGVHASTDVAVRPDKLSIAAGAGITAYVCMVVGIATLVWLRRHIAAVEVIAMRSFGSWVIAIALMLGAFEWAGR